MKETGIIMSGDHPAKILAGTKTMTRRTYGLEKINDMPYLWGEPRYDEEVGMWLFWQQYTGDCIHIKCPYGHIGDLLWVRETYAVRTDGVDQIMYKSDYHELVKMLDLPEINILWKPSIHMFRKDSRITREITGLRPERLQEIWLPDAIAEGCSLDFDMNHFGNYIDPLSKFKALWDSLNAKRGYSWAGNWWVWVISF